MCVLQFSYWIGDDDEEVTVQVDTYNPGTPGKYYGPWEDSYPSEPAECEFTVLRKDGSEYTPTDKECDAIESECLDRCYDLEPEYDE
jgi:hypothetical protein